MPFRSQLTVSKRYREPQASVTFIVWTTATLLWLASPSPMFVSFSIESGSWRGLQRWPLNHHAGSCDWLPVCRWVIFKTMVIVWCLHDEASRYLADPCSSCLHQVVTAVTFSSVFTHFAIQQRKLHRATCSRFDTIPACDGQHMQCEHWGAL